MGQYYKVVNVDKKEKLLPWDFSNGAKLMEWSYGKNHLVLAMLNLLAGKWKGDRVFVVGDYAEDDDEFEPCYETLRDLIDELGIRDETKDEYPVSVYGYASDNFENKSAECDTVDYGYRYIYNHDLKQYIDLRKCPIEWVWYYKDEDEADVTSIAPLPLLLAMGNDRGGGDFHKGCNGYEHVGSWCSTVKSIEITKEPIDGIDYEEFAPNFTEREKLVPYTDADRLIEECLNKYKEE